MAIRNLSTAGSFQSRSEKHVDIDCDEKVDSHHPTLILQG